MQLFQDLLKNAPKVEKSGALELKLQKLVEEEEME
jgi:hypothetical protein